VRLKPIHLLCIVTVLAHVTFAGTRINLSIYALQLNASPFVVGTLVAFVGVLPVLLSVAIGRWSDRAGPRRPMLTGTAVVAAAALIGFALGDLASLFAVALISGLGYNLFFVAQQQLMGRVGRPDELASNLSLIALAFSLSMFVTPLITGFAIDHAGARATFGLLASFSVAGCAVVWLAPKVFSSTSPASATQSGQNKRRIMDLLRMPELRRVYIVAVISQSTWDTLYVILPIYGQQHHLSASQVGTVFGTFSIFTLVVRLFLPAISRRTQPWQLLLFSLAGSALTYLGIPLTASMPPLLALVAWLGIALGVAAPMLLIVIHAASPPERVGEAVGLRVTLMNGSQTAIPLLAGSLVSLLGLTAMFWAFAALFFGGAWINRDRWRAPKGAGRA